MATEIKNPPSPNPLSVQNCASDVFNLVIANYPDLLWPQTQQALQLAHHDLLIRSQTYEPPPVTP